MLRSAALTEPESPSKAKGPLSFLGHAGLTAASPLLSGLFVAPLNGTLPHQSWAGSFLSAVALLGFASGLILWLRKGQIVERVCAVSVLLATLWLATALNRWSISSPHRLSSAWAACLSVSVFSLPWVAMLMCICALGLGLLQFRSFEVILQRWGTGSGTRKKAFAALFSAVSSALWLRALLGYASGTLELIP